MKLVSAIDYRSSTGDGKMLKQLLQDARVLYWRQKHVYHCTGVYYHLRIQPNTFKLYMESAKCDYYEWRLRSVGATVG